MKMKKTNNKCTVFFGASRVKKLEGHVPFRRGKMWLGGFLDVADFGSVVTGAVKYSYCSNSN